MRGVWAAVVVVLALVASCAAFSNPKWTTNPSGNRFKNAKFSFAAPFQFGTPRAG